MQEIFYLLGLIEYGCRNDRSGVDYRGELNYVGTDHRDTCERWDAGEHRFSRKVDFAGGSTLDSMMV